MNAAAVIFGIAGSIVAVFAVSSKPNGGGLRAFEAPAAPPPPDDVPPLRLPVVPARALTDSIPSHPVEVVNAAPAAAIPVQAGRGPKDAAKELLSYVSPLIRNGRGDSLGSKESPNDIVKAAQRDMRITADGIYGPKTAARGKELLGIEFPARTAAKRVVARQPPPTAAAPAAVRAAAAAPAAAPAPAIAEVLKASPPAPPPPPDTHVNEHSPKEAAQALYLYVTKPGAIDWGNKGKPNALIQAAQRDMGGITADGIYGPQTRERGKKLLGKSFPARR